MCETVCPVPPPSPKSQENWTVPPPGLETVDGDSVKFVTPANPTESGKTLMLPIVGAPPVGVGAVAVDGLFCPVHAARTSAAIKDAEARILITDSLRGVDDRTRTSLQALDKL